MRYCEAEAAALQGLKYSTKVVALMLAARTSDNTPDWPGRYVSFPGFDTLMKDTGLQKRALYYAINELVEAKVIRVYKDRHTGAQWEHNVYEWTATESPNYYPDWKKARDTQQSAVGARLTDEGWEYCRTHHVGPNLAAEQHPEFVLPAKQPTLIDVTAPENDGQLPIEAPESAPKPSKKITKTTRKHAIPEDWRPDEKTLARTRERYPSMPIDIEVDKFITHWLDKGEKRANWNLTWNRWCAKGNGFAKGAWTQQPTLTQSAQVAQRANNSNELTRDDFGYACLDMGIDPAPYINFWKPYMGLPSDHGWPEWAAKIDRHCGRA